jgi:hypothetical protein
VLGRVHHAALFTTSDPTLVSSDLTAQTYVGTVTLYEKTTLATTHGGLRTFTSKNRDLDLDVLIYASMPRVPASPHGCATVHLAVSACLMVCQHIA